MTLRLTLRGEPRHRTGTLRVNGDTYELATWHRAAAGTYEATTDIGQRVILTTDGQGGGGLSIGGRYWFLSDLARDGATTTGTAREGVSDAEMAEMFPGAGWEAP